MITTNRAMAVASAVVSAVAMTLPSFTITKNPETTTIIFPTVTTTTLVLILKIKMITIWMATYIVPPFPLLPIAALTMSLLEK